jgi:hypothetical protein
MREFEEAQKKFTKVMEIGSDDQPSQIFVVRCRDLIDAPPSSNWDGVFRLKEK